jgi:hypothetical protein
MTYVPTVPTPPTPPSPRTRELASLLTKVLEEYRKSHPALTSAEIRGAFKLAYRSTGDVKGRVAVFVSLVVVLLVGFMALGLFVFDSGGEADWTTAMPLVVMVVIFLLLVMLKMRSRSM